MKLLLSCWLCWSCHGWSLRRLVSRTSQPVRTMFKVATIATAISIGPMNAVADSSTTTAKQPSFLKDPFRMMRSSNAEVVDASVSSRTPSRTAVLTGTGAVIAFTIKAKAGTTDEVATKKRRRQLSSYLKSKKKLLVLAEEETAKSAEHRQEVLRKTSLVRKTNNSVKQDGSSTAIFSTDRMAFRKEPISHSNAPTVLGSKEDGSLIKKSDITSNNNTMIDTKTELKAKIAPLDVQNTSKQDVSAKYAAIESLEERAFQILLDLGMVEQTSGPSLIA